MTEPVAEPTVERVTAFPSPAHDLLFISYANEDGDFASWLAAKLTLAGYRVWCDRLRLRGGDSYPREIDVAIKTRSFRVLAVLSRSSISKANPVKERTLALNLARQRGVGFLLPLNLDGLASTDLDWMTSDLNFIPFDRGWGEGLRQLLRDLAKLSAPRDVAPQSDAITDWANATECPPAGPEPLVSSVLRFTAFPTELYRVASRVPVERRVIPGAPPRLYIDDRSYLSLGPPRETGTAEIASVPIDELARPGIPNSKDAATRLVALALQDLCTRRGLCEMDLARGRSRCYFPAGCGENGWIAYRMRSGRPSRIKVAGQRTFGSHDGARTPVLYNLVVELRPQLRLAGEPIVFLRLGLHLTSSDGRLLSPKIAFRRQRKIRNTWWNNATLARILAATQWLSNGAEQVDLAEPAGTLVLDARLISLQSPIGVTEPASAQDELADPELDDAALLDEGEGAGDDEEDDHADA